MSRGGRPGVLDRVVDLAAGAGAAGDEHAPVGQPDRGRVASAMRFSVAVGVQTFVAGF